MDMGDLFWEDVDDEASRLNIDERLREMQKRQDHFWSCLCYLPIFTVE